MGMHYLKQPVGILILASSFLQTAHGSYVAVNPALVIAPAPSTRTASVGTPTATARGARRSLSVLRVDLERSDLLF